MRIASLVTERSGPPFSLPHSTTAGAAEPYPQWTADTWPNGLNTAWNRTLERFRDYTRGRGAHRADPLLSAREATPSVAKRVIIRMPNDARCGGATSRIEHPAAQDGRRHRICRTEHSNPCRAGRYNGASQRSGSDREVSILGKRKRHRNTCHPSEHCFAPAGRRRGHPADEQASAPNSRYVAG